MQKTLRLGWLAAALLAVVCTPLPTHANLRKAKIGDRLAAFQLTDSLGKTRAYDPAKGRVTSLVFLPTMADQFGKTLEGMAKVHKTLEAHAGSFDLFGVISGSSGLTLLEKTKPSAATPVLLDTQYKLWGQLGVIATPTVVLTGADGKIQWIQAGYGYDFIPAMESRILQGLGVADKEAPGKRTQVKTVGNSTADARIQRHIQMSRRLVAKSEYAAAVKELGAARKLDPNAADVPLELGELLCMIGRPADAIKVVPNIESLQSDRKARALTITGWAYRRMNRLDDAEKSLLEAVRYNPTSARTQFELGKTYQAKGLKDKAVEVYYRALAILIGDDVPMPDSQK